MMDHKIVRNLNDVQDQEGWQVIEPYLTDKLREVIEAAVIPQWFTSLMLATLVECKENEANELYTELQKLPFVRESIHYEGSYQFNEEVREILIEYLCNEERDAFEQFSERACKYFESRKQYSEEDYIEWLYHLIIVDSKQANEQILDLINAKQIESKEDKKLHRKAQIINAIEGFYITSLEKQAARVDRQSFRYIIEANLQKIKSKRRISSILYESPILSKYFPSLVDKNSILNNLVDMEWHVDHTKGTAPQLMLSLSFSEQPQHVKLKNEIFIEKIGIVGGEIKLKNITNASIIIKSESKPRKFMITHSKFRELDEQIDENQDLSLSLVSSNIVGLENVWELEQVDRGIWEIKQEGQAEKTLRGRTLYPLSMGEIRIDNYENPVFIESEFEISNKDVILTSFEESNTALKSKLRLMYFILKKLILSGQKKANSVKQGEDAYVVKQLNQRLIISPRDS